MKKAKVHKSPRYGKASKVVKWPDGLAAILPPFYGYEEMVQAYRQAINRFARSYAESPVPQPATKGKMTAGRKKRRYTKRKGIIAANSAPNTTPEKSGNTEGK